MDFHLLLLLQREIPVVLTAHTVAVLVLYAEVPVKHWHGLLSLKDMGALLLDLQEGHIHGCLVALHGRVHLQEEGVRAVVGPARDVLRDARHGGLSVGPALFPLAGLDGLHALDHHVGEFLHGPVSLAAEAVSLLGGVLVLLHDGFSF